jgi:hypothetical protein
MTPSQRQEIARHLAAFDFSGLFTDSALGWNWPVSTGRLKVPYGKSHLDLTSVAEKCGVKILHCPPDSSGRIPLSQDRRKIEKAVTPHASEHLIIFTDAAKTRQVWQWPAKRAGKPSSLRELTWEKGKANELLFQKLSSIAFSLDEEEGLDITGVVQRLTDTLDRDRVTKRFYDLFKKQKDAFQKFIKGLSDEGLQAWYTSLMLNRIMFCYFLQRKGFLDGDQNYLSTRLTRVKDQMGKNQFHSFYRSFLRRLFHEGLGSQQRSKELAALIGDVPYLNGGIFDEHPIERGNPNISIPDEAFHKVFQFFDQFDWHLDDRPIGNDKEINPEILGYVFEKYTNQKEMGAYYTKEDITEYISKNCIIPFLVQAVATKLPDSAWAMLQADPDRYIYSAVRHGAHESLEQWQAALPANIAKGLDTTKPKLLERRKDWNTTTPAPFNLPTEIWRETIARHQRCHDIRAKLRSGQVRSIEDFITLNLNIRQFAQDLIESADASLALAVFAQMKTLSVLDPTCGSGAFLFAALEILEPLYTACIQRFRALLADWQSSGEKHPNWEKEIKRLLEQIAAHPNESYYIHKTIIVHNLYGVDIMEEAVEICKLRLFLKLAAQLEPGQQVEPLPDIDFNIRAGNSLVGYASRDEVRRAFTEHQGGSGGGQLLLGGIEHSLDDYRRIEEQAEDADRAFKRFHQLQESAKMDPAEFRKAKADLHSILEALRDQLDHFLAGDYDKKHLKSDSAFQKWKASHQPFHWFIEFYGIMNRGGFDVIVGNPPYVEMAKISSYTPRGYTTLQSGNLYAVVSERCTYLMATSSLVGLIVPLSVVCTARMQSLRNALVKSKLGLWLSHFSGDANPSKLFEGAKLRLTILIGKRTAIPHTFSTQYSKWYAKARAGLFERLEYQEILGPTLHLGLLPKIGNSVTQGLIPKLLNGKDLAYSMTSTGSNIYVHRVITQFVKCLNFIPYFKNEADGQKKSEDYKLYTFRNLTESKAAIAAINSTIFFYYFILYGDCFHCGKDFVNSFPLTLSSSPQTTAALALIAPRLMSDLKKHAVRKQMTSEKTGVVAYDEFWPSKSKPIIDEIDKVLAKHYGFTEEELDFIINYDIKYRMGLGRDSKAGQNEEED